MMTCLLGFQSIPQGFFILETLTQKQSGCKVWPNKRGHSHEGQSIVQLRTDVIPRVVSNWRVIVQLANSGPEQRPLISNFLVLELWSKSLFTNYVIWVIIGVT